VQTGEGALSEVHSMLQRVRDLKVQFNNGTLSSDDKDAISAEVYQISTEISSIATTTQFNGKNVFGATGFTFQVGANDGETVSTVAADFGGSIAAGGLSDLTAINSASAASTALATGALSTLDTLDSAIKNVSTARANFGAVQNRLEHRLNNLATYQENLTASESRIRDVDMASEMTNYTKNNILQQAGTSMLAQANQAPQNILSLLKG
jgi:flagellin